jgi:hypothetical protein
VGEYLAQNNFPRIIGDKWKLYQLQRQNSVSRCFSEIQSTPPQGHPALTLDFEPILVVKMSGVEENFRSVIDEMTYGTDCNVINLVHTENANLTHGELNTSFDMLENRWNIHFV